MIISVTERGSFKRCRQQWEYSSFNRQRLSAVSQPTALAFGTLVHKVHENWLESPAEDVQEIIMNVAADTLDVLQQNYIAAIGVPPDERELAGFGEQVELTQEVFANYQTRWGSSLPEGYTLMHAEQTIVIPIPGTEHQCTNVFHTTGNLPDVQCPECKGPWTSAQVIPHYLEATLDGLMKDAGDRLWVLERKTYNQKPRIEALQSNDQFLAYLWVVQQLNIGPIGGVFYDGVWKRSRLDNRGKERDLDDLFFRTPLIRAPEELANFTTQLQYEVTDMAEAVATGRIYRNRRWEGCWDCSYERLCSAEFRDEDADYVRRTQYTKRVGRDWDRMENEQ